MHEKQESLERRRSYLRGFRAVNCIGAWCSHCNLGKNSSFLVIFKRRSDKKNRGVALDV